MSNYHIKHLEEYYQVYRKSVREPENFWEEIAEEHFVLFATAKGTVKKVSLTQFSRPRANGIIALELLDDDYLIGADLTNGHQDVMLFTDAGKVIRFDEAQVRPMGRTARGVRGVKLKEGQNVIALVIAKEGGAILTATENGYGKRTDMTEYRQTGRGGQGVISIQVTDRNGLVIGAKQVTDEDDIMLISNGGVLVRTPAKDISVISRNTQGVRLINLDEGENLVSLAKVDEDVDDTDEVEKEEPAGFDDVNEVLSSYRRAQIIAKATGQWPVSSERSQEN